MLDLVSMTWARYRLLIEVALVGLFLLWAAHKWHSFVAEQQDIGYQKARAEVQEENKRLKAELAAKTQEAIKNANERDKAIQALAASSRDASNGLHDTIEAITRSLGNASGSTAYQTAATYGRLLDDCQAKYRGMAEAATGHASDVKTLIEAWPQTSK